MITNASGGIVRESDYYPFGGERVIGTPSLDDPHKFAGMYRDSESGLYHTWFRMYSPSLGRWLAPDPIAGAVEKPGSLNRYTYVLNNPLNLVDALGLLWGPPIEPPDVPDYTPFFDPPGYTPPNPYGNPTGCTAPDGQCGGNPGGGGGGEKPKLEGKASDAQKEAFQKAVDEALERLQTEECAKLFGSGALKAFSGARYGFAPLGKPRPDNQGVARVTGATTPPDITPRKVFINSQGPFVNQLLFVPGMSGPQLFDFGTGLRGAEFGAVLLLHELGHLTGVFGPDADKPELNRSYTDKVLDKCF